MLESNYTKRRGIVQSYYSIYQQRHNSCFTKESSAIASIVLSARKKSVSPNLTLSKIKNSTSLKTEPKHTIFKTDESYQSIYCSRSRDKQYFHRQQYIRQPIPRLLSDYQKLYEVSLKNPKQIQGKTKMEDIKQSPLKRRGSKRFNRILTQQVSPQFNRKLVQLRKIHILNDLTLKFDQLSNIKPTIRNVTAMCQSPGNREGCTLHYIDRKVYVIGGRSTNPRHCVEYLDILKNQWSLTVIVGYHRRSYHSCLLYQSQLYIVGGFTEPFSGKDRELSSELQIINLKTKGVSRTKISDLLKRSSHSSILDGHSIIITGGVDEKGNLLGDGLRLCLMTKKMVKQIMPLQLSRGFAKHSVCRGKLGIYLLGGITSEGYNTNVYINSKQQWVKRVIYGKFLVQSVNMNVQYIDKIERIVIYGGTTSDNPPRQLRRILLFDESENTIVKIQSEGIEVMRQFGYYCGGASTSNSNTMYIFGGSNSTEYNTQLYSIDFSFV